MSSLAFVLTVVTLNVFQAFQSPKQRYDAIAAELQTLAPDVATFQEVAVRGHLTSVDGKSNWVNRGLAYDPTREFIRYTDGSVNHWEKLERPGVLIENGHVTALTLAAIDVSKGQDKRNDHHGSKIIVIPLDGAALDRDLRNAAGTPATAGEQGKAP